MRSRVLLLPFSASAHPRSCLARILPGAGVLLAALAMAAAAGPAEAAVEGDQITVDLQPDFKWVQYPDLGETGLDVNATSTYILADDFLCGEPGIITNIRVWGSWLDDTVQLRNITLSIREDIPASQSPTGYSMPGELLWTRRFDAGSFGITTDATGLHAGWLNPPSDYSADRTHTCYQYSFDIPPERAFFQEGTALLPKVYWLSVQAVPLESGPKYGWKTTAATWNDAAVWGVGMEPFNGSWTPLSVMGMAGPRPLHLAFAVQSEPVSLDFGDAPEVIGTPGYPTTLARNGARHRLDDVTTMGSLMDPDGDGQPSAGANGDDLNWIDDEDGAAFLTPVRAGETARIGFTFSVYGYLSGWIDWNRDMVWDPSTEEVAHSYLSSGANTVTFPVPLDAQPGTTYARFRFCTVDWTAPTGYAGNGEVEDYQVEVLEAVGLPKEEPPREFLLHEATPNPFAFATSLRFELPQDERARVDVFAVNGRRVTTLLDAELPAGRHDAVWDGLDERGAPVPAGRYYLRVLAGPYRQTRPVVLLK